MVRLTEKYLEAEKEITEEVKKDIDLHLAQDSPFDAPVYFRMYSEDSNRAQIQCNTTNAKVVLALIAETLCLFAKSQGLSRKEVKRIVMTSVEKM